MLKTCLKLFMLVALVGIVPAVAQAQQGRAFRATLVPTEEVPALSNVATGTFTLLIDFGDTSFDFSLTFSGMSGTGATQSHIHLGQKGVNGGIVVFFCTNLGNAPPGPAVQACPANGTIGGTITAANVSGGAGAQGIAAGEFAEVLKAIRAGVVYVNVHSALFPGGEIRGQLVPGFGPK
jgi:CHRD domain-containing protein